MVKICKLNKENRWIVAKRDKSIELWARIVYIHYKLNGNDIPKGYIIHHKNGNTEDDNIENLKMMSIKQHIQIHRCGKHLLEITKFKISVSKKGRKLSGEHKYKIGLAGIGRKHSTESKLKIGMAQKTRIRSPLSEEHRKKIRQSLLEYNKSRHI